VSPYAELHCHSCFSLLDGSSTPEALVERAVELGMPALALTDHDGLYGAVRFYVAARERGIHPIIGAEVTLEGDSHLVLLAENRAGYANLCALISRSQLNGSKGQARLKLGWLRGRTEGLIALTGCRKGRVPSLLLAGEKDKAVAALRTLRSLFGPRNVYVELQHHLDKDDAALIADLAELAGALRLPVVATHNVHYAAP
jgi:DNA polymerase III alpha subunit